MSRVVWTPAQWTRWAKQIGRDTSAMATARAHLQPSDDDAESPAEEIEGAMVAVLSRFAPIEAVAWIPPADDDYLWGELQVRVVSRTVAMTFLREPLMRVAFRGVCIDLEDADDPPPYTIDVPTAQRLDQAAEWLHGRTSIQAFGLVENRTIARLRAWLDEAPVMHANELARQLYARFEIVVPAVQVVAWLRSHEIQIAPETPDLRSSLA